MRYVETFHWDDWGSFLRFSRFSVSAETEPVEKTGIKVLQLGTDREAVVPGEVLDVGLFIQHVSEYHTYWKAPGIVGYPTSITWEMPEGFTASEIEWPVPELTKMAQYSCYGYERDVCLISQIQVPESIDAEEVSLKAKVSFMCCAKTCHPGWQDFTLTLPVVKDGKKAGVDRKWQKRIAEARKVKPVSPPESWSTVVSISETEVIVVLENAKGAFVENEAIYCFCEDNQVHSDRPQVIERSEDKKTLTFKMVRSEFAPKDLTEFTGLLFHPGGWAGDFFEVDFVKSSVFNQRFLVLVRRL